MIEVHIKVVLVQLQIFASTSYEFRLRKTYKKNTNRGSQTLTEMVSVEVNSRGIN